MRLACCVALAMMAALPAQAQVQRCPDKLPAAVEARRAAIVKAATSRDWAALERLIGPGEFVYSFGDAGDPIGYWRDSVKQGTDIPRYLAAIFSMPCALSLEEDRPQYWWPAATEFEWKDLTAAEQAALDALYDGKVDEWYIEGRATGYYVGWRGSIEKRNGAWSSFVAGD